MDDALEGCPFCGEIPELMSYSGRSWVTCHNTDCSMEAVATYLKPSPEEAIAAWNQRAPKEKE